MEHEHFASANLARESRQRHASRQALLDQIADLERDLAHEKGLRRQLQGDLRCVKEREARR